MSEREKGRRRLISIVESSAETFRCNMENTDPTTTTTTTETSVATELEPDHFAECGTGIIRDEDGDDGDEGGGGGTLRKKRKLRRQLRRAVPVKWSPREMTENRPTAATTTSECHKMSMKSAVMIPDPDGGPMYVLRTGDLVCLGEGSSRYGIIVDMYYDGVSKGGKMRVRTLAQCADIEGLPEGFQREIGGLPVAMQTNHVELVKNTKQIRTVRPLVADMPDSEHDPDARIWFVDDEYAAEATGDRASYVYVAKWDEAYLADNHFTTIPPYALLRHECEVVPSSVGGGGGGDAWCGVSESGERRHRKRRHSTTPPHRRYNEDEDECTGTPGSTSPDHTAASIFNGEGDVDEIEESIEYLDHVVQILTRMLHEKRRKQNGPMTMTTTRGGENGDV